MKQEIAEKHEEIEQQIESGIELTGERIRGTNYRIQRIEAVYAELLEAQYRRTLDSLYTESELLEKKQEAARLFQEGKYAAAREQYAAISRARPEDVEARFYQWYSLFLSNKMDMSNYQQIKEGLRGLEQAGYHRAEIKEILGYITTEEGGQ
jgi:thioredoxin-like negative regulator of GroEL